MAFPELSMLDNVEVGVSLAFMFFAAASKIENYRETGEPDMEEYWSMMEMVSKTQPTVDKEFATPTYAEVLQDYQDIQNMEDALDSVGSEDLQDYSEIQNLTHPLYTEEIRNRSYRTSENQCKNASTSKRCAADGRSR